MYIIEKKKLTSPTTNPSYENAERWQSFVAFPFSSHSRFANQRTKRVCVRSSSSSSSCNFFFFQTEICKLIGRRIEIKMSKQLPESLKLMEEQQSRQQWLPLHCSTRKGIEEENYPRPYSLCTYMSSSSSFPISTIQMLQSLWLSIIKGNEKDAPFSGENKYKKKKKRSLCLT
jgi:hypothetical protein